MSGRAASLGHGMRADPERIALGILRVSLAASLLLGVEKFVLPEATVRIWGNLYGVSIDRAIVPVIGLLEGALAIAIGLGLWRRVSYGLGTIVHGISVLSTWRQLVDRPLHGRPGTRARVGGDGPAGVRSAWDDPASGGCPGISTGPVV